MTKETDDKRRAKAIKDFLDTERVVARSIEAIDKYEGEVTPEDRAAAKRIVKRLMREFPELKLGRKPN